MPETCDHLLCALTHSQSSTNFAFSLLLKLLTLQLIANILKHIVTHSRFSHFLPPVGLSRTIRPAG